MVKVAMTIPFSLFGWKGMRSWSPSSSLLWAVWERRSHIYLPLSGKGEDCHDHTLLLFRNEREGGHGHPYLPLSRDEEGDPSRSVDPQSTTQAFQSTSIKPQSTTQAFQLTSTDLSVNHPIPSSTHCNLPLREESDLEMAKVAMTIHFPLFGWKGMRS